MVRELDFSKVTLRLREKGDKNKDGDEDHTFAKLSGNTSDTLRQCLNTPTVLKLTDKDGGVSQIKLSLRYLPVNMNLDASESINNMGTLRVDVLDAADLPAADRSGYSDPFCLFKMADKEVFKTKVQKKTLHPAWNEFFETTVQSRTAGNFKVDVFDWDFADKPDFLGSAKIDLAALEPFEQREQKFALDGKSGTVRLRLLFKPTYVTRSRQGSSTFSGTFATPGKIVTGVAGAPLKGGMLVGGGVLKGASFIRHGFKSKKKDGSNGTADLSEEPIGDSISASPSGANGSNGLATTPTGSPSHSRSRSFGSQSLASAAGGRPSTSAANSGTASFTLVSADGYPPASNVRVTFKQVTGKGAKEVHKSKAVKAGSGEITWEHETFKVPCTADQQFQIQVKDHSTFGSDDDLGEALFFVDDSGLGSEKVIKAGSGSVTLKSTFAAAAGDSGSIRGSIRDSPKASGGLRRSFLSKREPSRGEQADSAEPQ
jgi:Ca2+-dependent lipid-binding protein